MCTDVHLLCISFRTFLRQAHPITNLHNDVSSALTAVYFPPKGTKFTAITSKCGRLVYCNVLGRISKNMPNESALTVCLKCGPPRDRMCFIDALSPWSLSPIYFAGSVSLAVHWPRYWHGEAFVCSEYCVSFQQNDTFPRYAANCLIVPSGPVRERQQTVLPGRFVGELHIYLGCLGLLTVSENGIVIWVQLALD